MRLRWKPFDRREAPLGMIYGAVLAGCALLAAAWIRLGLPRPACPLREFAGLPCPTCGSTRLVEALLRGDAGAAFVSNPLVFVALVAMGAWALGSTLRRAVHGPTPVLALEARDGVWIRVTVVLVGLCGWAWVILVDAA